MTDERDIVDRLMDYDTCNDAEVDEAAKEITTLRQRLAAAEAERDVLLACRHGDQRCYECPDITCCDNLNEAAKGGRDEDATS